VRASSQHPVLVLSSYPERQYAISVALGANEVPPKESAPEELSKAVKTVLSGRRYVSAALADFLVSDLDADVTKRFMALRA
jgi:DNA-binding NarL/FixJ family response regulator